MTAGRIKPFCRCRRGLRNTWKQFSRIASQVNSSVNETASVRSQREVSRRLDTSLLPGWVPTEEKETSIALVCQWFYRFSPIITYRRHRGNTYRTPAIQALDRR